MSDNCHSDLHCRKKWVWSWRRLVQKARLWWYCFWWSCSSSFLSWFFSLDVKNEKNASAMFIHGRGRDCLGIQINLIGDLGLLNKSLTWKFITKKESCSLRFFKFFFFFLKFTIIWCLNFEWSMECKTAKYYSNSWFHITFDVYCIFFLPSI